MQPRREGKQGGQLMDRRKVSISRTLPNRRIPQTRKKIPGSQKTGENKREEKTPNYVHSSLSSGASFQDTAENDLSPPISFPHVD